MADNEGSLLWVNACVALLLMCFSAAPFPCGDTISSPSVGDGSIDCDAVDDPTTAGAVGSGAGALRILSLPTGPGPRADEVSGCCCLVVDRDVDDDVDAAVIGRPRGLTAGS